MKIYVTGGNGQLGMSLKKISLEIPDHTFRFFDSKELDITSSTSVIKAFDESHPDIIINCAAYTAVDKAEDETEKTFAVNGEGVRNLVRACEKFGAAFIHISTDYVFDGAKKEPYTEKDTPNPINVYGESKLAGEKHVLNSQIKAIIIRTSWVYSEFGNNFVKTMLRLGREKEAISVVGDQLGSPTYAKDLAKACIATIDQLDKWPLHPTVYHFCNQGETSWYSFAKEIMKLGNVNCKVSSIPTSAYPTKAQRPMYSAMNSSVISNQFVLISRHWQEALHDYLLTQK